MKKFQLILITFLSFLLMNEVTFNLTSSSPQEWLQINSAAYARRGGSSGGRSRGGSFGGSSSKSKSSSPSRSSGSSSSPTRSRPTPSSGSSSTRDTRPTSQPTPSTINQGNTGGRVRGGSFTPAPVPTPLNTPRPYNPPTSTGTTNYPYYPPSRSRDTTIIVPVPVPAPQPYYQQPYPVQTPQQNVPVNSEVNPVTQPATNPQNSSVESTNTSNNGSFWKFLFFLLLAGGAVFLAWYLFSRKRQAGNELDNDIVTVSKLQIALLAEARHIQSHLSDLSVAADLETPEGLTEFLHETALALLRSPEYWTHALASSQTVKNREQAAKVFEQLSIEERSKFSAETFSNVGGRIQQRSAYSSSPDNEPAAYIVVTFLVGTEDDQPLFGNIHTTEELQQTLQKLAAITPDYLLIFELLWSPESETDSLSYDELLIHYSDMIQI